MDSTGSLSSILLLIPSFPQKKVSRQWRHPISLLFVCYVTFKDSLFQNPDPSIKSSPLFSSEEFLPQNSDKDLLSFLNCHFCIPSSTSHPLFSFRVFFFPRTDMSNLHDFLRPHPPRITRSTFIYPLIEDSPSVSDGRPVPQTWKLTLSFGDLPKVFTLPYQININIFYYDR